MKHFQTKESHIYAIGDVIGGLQLAHVASHEGIARLNILREWNCITRLIIAMLLDVFIQIQKLQVLV